jgi:hypothetical protein
MTIMTPLDFQEDCQQTVAIATLMFMLIMAPVHFIGMFTLFLKADKMFNPNRLLANRRRRLFVNRVTNK